MAARLLDTILYLLLFLLAFLLLLRYIRSEEGFANPTGSETYDLNLFFENYPIQKACFYYEKILPEVVKNFSLDETGKQLPESIAKEGAEQYIRSSIVAGVPNCPFELPKSKNLSVAADFVKDLDEKLLAKAMNTLLFYAANIKVAIVNAKNAEKQQAEGMKEGFLTECSAVELAAQSVVPLQCIPAEKMKATEQQEINKVDKFEMEQRVSDKSAIAKKLQAMVVYMNEFLTDYKNITQSLISDLRKQVQRLEINYNLIKDETSKDAEFLAKRDDLKQKLDQKKNELTLTAYYNYYSKLSMKKLADECDKLTVEKEASVKSLESASQNLGKT
jgi:hypothetical protein